MKRVGLWVVLVGCLTSGGLAACGDDGDDDVVPPPLDAGRDAVADAKAAADASQSGDGEAPFDGGNRDAGSDADAEAGADARPDADAGPSPCTVGAGGAYATIQAAVDAKACAKIHVLPGLYAENVTIGDAVEIDGDAAATTIIEGAATSAGVTVTSANVTLKNLTVRKAKGGITSTADLTLLGMVISGNAGSGIAQAGKSLTLCDATVVEDNTADEDGGGVHASDDATVSIGCKSIIRNNTAAGTSARGGGLYVENSTLGIDDASVVGNHAAVSGGTNVYGGGIHATKAKVTLTNNAIIDANVASVTSTPTYAVASGGGLYLDDASTLTATDAMVTNNQAAGTSHTEASSEGGGVDAQGASVVLTRCTVKGNMAKSTADAVANADATGGGIVHYGSTLTVTESTIDSNTAIAENTSSTGAAYGTAGGIFVYATPGHNETVRFVASSIVRNTASATLPAGAGSGGSYGGALYIRTAGGDSAVLSATFVNSTISDNKVFNTGGKTVTARAGALEIARGFDFETSSTAFYNTTIAGNTATEAGGIYAVTGKNISTKLANTILAGNAATTSADCEGPVTSIGHSLFGTTAGCTYTAGAGDVVSASSNLDALGNNGGSTPTRALGAGSTAINAGDPAGCKDDKSAVLATDQRGTARNGVCDIGSYEK